MNILTSRARRPKNAWFLFSSKVGDQFQIDIGYKTSSGVVGGYSSSPQNARVKIPWGPPTKCDFNIRRSGDEVVKEFKFFNRRHESASFDEVILKMLEGGVQPFSQKVTSLCVQGQKKLLSNYLTLVQSSSEFIFHREMIHDEDGFMMDGSGVSVKDLEDNGGSVTEYRDFLKLVKESSNEVSKTGDVSLEMVRKRADGRKKRKPEGERTEPDKKKSKTAIVNDDENFELEDSAGLEQKYMTSFIGLANIPLKNLKIPSELKSMVNIYRVYRIMTSMKAKFDPSQTILVCLLRMIANHQV